MNRHRVVRILSVFIRRLAVTVLLSSEPNLSLGSSGQHTIEGDFMPRGVYKEYHDLVDIFSAGKLSDCWQCRRRHVIIQ